ncbi:peroxiredoxin [Lentzea sp. NPDC060358]|uniref:peroxiredoxin n=1 Tax=Lentzea sp. NPDC060358 TaxID=3347103 RepID=UPI00365D2717
MERGDTAPDFTLPDDGGEPRSLSGFLASGPVVLFFYPAAMTGGCTAESCHFRDLAAEFAEVGAHRVGISPDAVGTQRAFSAANGFDYPLLSDVDGVVARQFGAWRRFSPLHARRRTFVIDTDRRVLGVVKSELRFTVHADEALAVLRQRAERGGEQPRSAR